MYQWQRKPLPVLLIVDEAYLWPSQSLVFLLESLPYVPSVSLASDKWQEVVFGLAPEVFVPHPDHSDGNNDLDWPIVGLVIGVSNATTTFYVDDIKIGEGEEEKSVSSSGKLTITWGNIKSIN